MKRRSAFLWVTFALFVALPGCSPSIQTAETPRPALVTVECEDASVRQVLDLLRSARGKDIAVQKEGYIVGIKVAFSPEYTSAERLTQILHDLDNMGGVIHTEVVENPRPVKQGF